jgi:3-methyladenine DNA glycosylase AlkD
MESCVTWGMPKRPKSCKGFLRPDRENTEKGRSSWESRCLNCEISPRKYADLDDRSVVGLLQSAIHEERLLSLLILIRKYSRGTDEEKKRIYGMYLANTRYINNWDLVDLSAEHIVGHFVMKRSKQPLHELARSSSLWERRIAIMATFRFIKQHQYKETLKIAKILMTDEEDLIHKAVGWMLRETGKRDLKVEEEFLKKHYKKMPRTMLREKARMPRSEEQG